MNIKEKFSKLKERNEGVLIGFVTAGDPSVEDTVEIADALIAGGIDILELGLPFSDPIADGPVIQKAGERALQNGMNTDMFFETAGKIKGIPKLCLTYYNMILQRGFDRFTKECSMAGIGGLVVPDLPIEEAEPLLSECDKKGVSLIFLAAPTTTEDRLIKILEKASGFLYVVSLTGVTGERTRVSSQLKPLIDMIKNKSSDLPLAVGFGISQPEHVREVLEAGADAAIVGSAFVRIIEKNIGDRERMLDELEDFARELKSATK